MRARDNRGGREAQEGHTVGTGGGRKKRALVVRGGVILAASCRDELLPSRAPHRGGGNAPPAPPSGRTNSTTRCGTSLSADSWLPEHGSWKPKSRNDLGSAAHQFAPHFSVSSG